MQETNENKELIENIDNMAEETTGEKNQSASKIFFFVLGLHVLVIAGAIALHMMRGPTPASPRTDSAQSGAAQQPPASFTREVVHSPAENTPPTKVSLQTNPLQSDASSQESKSVEGPRTEITTPEPELMAQTPPMIPEQEQSHPASTEKEAQQPAEITYIVRPGDTLSIIARRHNTTIARIVRDNAKNNEKIVVGERLVIKSAEAAVPTSHTANAAETQRVKPPVAKVQQLTRPPGSTVQRIQAESPPFQTDDSATLNAPVEQTSVQNTPPSVVSTNPPVHTVTKGDTLFSISRKYGATVEDIKKWNGMQTEKLTVGKTLRLSPPVATNQSSGPQTPAQTHTQNAPSTDSSPSVNVQKQQTPSIVKTSSQVPKPAAKTIHTVSAGETLSSVARKYNTTVQNIKQDNQLTADLITIGQKLAVTPGDAAEQNQAQNDASLVHVVRPGDTLSSISRSFGVPIEALFAANNLQNPNIRVGQKLFIPATVSEKNKNKNTNTSPANPTTQSMPAPTEMERTQPETYTVQPGDTLFKIALKYGVTVESLSSANKISGADILRVGQELVIPNSNITEVAKN